MNVTLVTAYFKIKSKHTENEYLNWIKNLLKIKTPIVFFTDIPEIVKYRNKDYPLKIIKCSYTDFFVYKYYDIWEKSHNLDPEKNIHNKYLYMIWNEKSNFIKKAIDYNYFNSEYFYWVDAGCFRNNNTIKYFINFPKRVTEKILLLNICKFTEDEIIDPNNIKNIFKYVDRIGAGIFGGNKKNVIIWWKKYYEILDILIKTNQFAGKEQSNMAILYLLNKDLVDLIQPDKNRFSRWFYLQEYLTL